jgi:hypothetical protein
MSREILVAIYTQVNLIMIITNTLQVIVWAEDVEQILA